MRLMSAALAVVSVLALALPDGAGATTLPDGVDPATGFRLDNYRAPTPDFVPGGTVLDTASVRAAIEGKTAKLIDVYAKGVVADPATGAWSVSDPHETIPGAIWVPLVGSGKLKPEMETYFRNQLKRLTGDDQSRPVIFFCMADCWHSWNAAKRAADWGYTAVNWYPLGTDGWKEEGGTLVPATPEPVSGPGG